MLIWAPLLFSVTAGSNTTNSLSTTSPHVTSVTGMPTVKQGDASNLTCSVDRFHPFNITWTLGSNKNLQKQSPQNDTGKATLVVHNVTEEHGQYVCTAKHQDTTLTIYAEVTVRFQLKNRTDVCVSEKFPLPNIKWPLLKNDTITTMSDHTDYSVSAEDYNFTTVECISSTDLGKAQQNQSSNGSYLDNLLQKLSTIVQQPQVIIAFLTGILLSATICCLVRKCHRTKQKSSGNVAETLEMVTTQEDPLINAGEAVENDGTHDQEADEGGAVAGQSAPGGDVEPKEVEYSNIDFFVLKRNSPSDKTQETTETEYAEIKKGDKEERQDNGREGGEMFEGNEEEKVIIGEEKETKQCMSADEAEGVEDVPVYSTVNEVMDEI